MSNLGSLTATLGVDTRGLAKAERTFKGVMGRMKSQVFSLKGALIALGGALALRELKRGIVDVTHMAGRYEELGIAMKVAGENAGYSEDQVAAFQKAIEKSGIAAIEARQTLTRMAVAQIDLARSSKLARAAQDVAVVGAINSSEAFERLIYGIQTAQVRVLRTIGINVTFEEGYKKLAKSIGKTTEQLTEQEKTQSRVNTVLDAAARYQGLYEQAMTSAEKQFRSMKRHVDNFKVALGKAFQPAYLALVLKFTDLFKKARDAVGDIAFSTNLGLIANKIIDSFSFMINMVLGGISKLKKEGKLDEYFSRLSSTVVSVMKTIAYTGAVAADALRGVVLAFTSIKAVLLYLQKKEWQAAIKRLVESKGGYEANKKAIDDYADSINKAEKRLEEMNKSFEETAMQPLAITQVTEGFKKLEDIWKNQETVAKAQIDTVKELEAVTKTAIESLATEEQKTAVGTIAEKRIDVIRQTVAEANNAIKQAGSISEAEAAKVASIWKSVIEKDVQDAKRAILDAAKAEQQAADDAKRQADQHKDVANTMSLIVDGQQKTIDLGNEANGIYNSIQLQLDEGKLKIDEQNEKLEKQNEILTEQNKILTNRNRMLSSSVTSNVAGVVSHEARGGFLPERGIQHFQNSGIMPGFSSRDKYLAAFRGGEAFISPERVQQAGRDTIQSIIDGTFRKPTEQITVNFRTNEGDHPIVVNKSPTLNSFLAELRKGDLLGGA